MVFFVKQLQNALNTHYKTSVWIQCSILCILLYSVDGSVFPPFNFNNKCYVYL